jgi:uncharacterized protein (TIGR03435 family)
VAVSREEFSNMSGGAGAMVMMPPGMADMGRQSDVPGRGELDSSVFTSLRSLGLKLKSQKESVDVLVVDHLERTPTAN